jgi:hypothetical protein
MNVRIGMRAEDLKVEFRKAWDSQDIRRIEHFVRSFHQNRTFDLRFSLLTSQR